MTTARIRCEALYWGIIQQEDDLGATARRYAWERLLPEPVEGLVVRELRLDRRRWLLVGAPAGVLAQRLGDADAASAWSLIPDRIPEHIRAQAPDADPARLDLRRGAFEPPLRRRLRRLLLAAGWIGWIGVASALAVGLERRTAAVTSEAAVRAARDEIEARRILGGSVAEGVPLDAALTMATRHVDLLAPAMERRHPAADHLLGALLARWPAAGLRVTDIAVSGNRVLVGLMDPAPDAIAALRADLAQVAVGGGLLRLEPGADGLAWSWEPTP